MADMVYNAATDRYEFTYRDQEFSITPAVRQSMIQAYIDNQFSGDYNSDKELYSEAEEYVDNPYNWTPEEWAELEWHARWSREATA